MRAFRWFSLATVAALALGTGCSEQSQQACVEHFRDQLFEGQYRDMEQTVQREQAKVLARAIGLAVPSGGPSTLNAIGSLYVMDAYWQLVWSGTQFHAADDEFYRRHCKRLQELWSILRLFASPTGAVKL